MNLTIARLSGLLYAPKTRSDPRSGPRPEENEQSGMQCEESDLFTQRHATTAHP